MAQGKMQTRSNGSCAKEAAASSSWGDACSQWAACRCIWAATALMDAWTGPFLFPNEFWRALSVAAALVVVVLPSKALFGVALAINNGRRMAIAPFLWDSSLWSVFCDAALVVGLVKARGTGCVVSIAAPIVQALLAVFYFASGFWKINSSFLSPRTSCSSIFTASLLARIWPEDWGVPSVRLSQLVVRVAPLATIVGECSAGLLVLLPGRWRLVGLCLMLSLHAGISYTPFPNGIANFSYTAASRYVFLLPAATATALHQLRSQPRSTAGCAGRAAAVAAVAAGWRASSAAGPQREGAVFFTLLAVLYAWAVWLELRLPTTERRGLGASGWVLVAVAGFFAFGTQVLGLQDLGAPASPFSSIAVHGGSNHLLLPTGLLQAWAHEGGEDSFAGGVVRVEFTDSAWLNALFPGEETSDLPAFAVKVLRRGGHVARQFNPTPRRVFTPELRALMPRWRRGDGPFPQYTVPAMELRRLVAEARANEEAFSLTYTRLPGAVGDARWRTSAQGPRVEYFESRNGTRRCVVDGQPCSPTELVLLPELGFWARKTRLFFPHPIVEGAGGELPCID